MSYDVAFGFQGLMPFGVEGEETWICASAFTPTGTDQVQVRIMDALPLTCSLTLGDTLKDISHTQKQTSECIFTVHAHTHVHPHMQQCLQTQSHWPCAPRAREGYEPLCGHR